MTITGGCRCGAVRFTCDAEPITTRACWCRDCQYWAAGNAALNVVLPADGFQMTGETTAFFSLADSGTQMFRRFCPACGTPVISGTEARPHLVVVRIGTLDDSTSIAPQMTIWTDSAPPWARFDPDLPTYPGNAPAIPPPIG